MTECPIPFPYSIRAIKWNVVELTIDAAIAELISEPDLFICYGANAWRRAVRKAQELREEFHASWRDAHGTEA